MLQHSKSAGLQEIGRVLIDDTIFVIKSARVKATASGDTQIIAAVAGKQIALLAWTIGPVSAAVVVTIRDADGTPVVMAGPFECAANGGIANSDYKKSDQLGTSNTAINVNLSTTANVPVHLWFVEKT